MDTPGRDRLSLLSVIVPFLNEGPVIDSLFERLLGVLGTLGCPQEVLCVDNGSRDDTLPRLLAWRDKDPRIKVLALSKYFGKEAALTAGLDHCAGQAVVLMDPDLQDPPELIAEFIAKWKEGFDVVYATRRSSGIESALRRAANALFYRLFNILSESPIPASTGDFRLIDRRVVGILSRLPERARFLRALSTWVGFRSAAVYFDRPARKTGESKSTSFFLWGYALEAIMSSTTRPLRVWTYFGASIFGLAMLGLVAVWLPAVIVGGAPTGYASMMLVILFLGAFQLISIGVIAEYVGRIYREVQGRPLYIIDRAYGVEPSPPSDHAA